jgi:hypothetical protein
MIASMKIYEEERERLQRQKIQVLKLLAASKPEVKNGWYSQKPS